jgi:hypothetical protein
METVGREWDLFQDSQKRRWESIFRLPSVRTLQIINFRGIPISALFLCHNIESLYVDKFTSFAAPNLERSVENAFLPLTNITSVQTAREFNTLDPLFNVYPSIGAPLIDKNIVKYLFVNRISDDDCYTLKDFPSLRSFDADICESTSMSQYYRSCY